MRTERSVIGLVFGRLTIIGDAKPRFTPKGLKQRFVTCVCICGKTNDILLSAVTSGHTKYCGCAKREAVERTFFKHGHARAGNHSRIYMIWCSMIKRCTNPKDPEFENYGGRGIRVCERWLSFPNFLADMGEPPKGMSIERKNNFGNYEPDNCKWDTIANQARNRRTNHILTINGLTGCLTDLCHYFGLSRAAISTRINRHGWTPERAFNTPVKNRLRG